MPDSSQERTEQATPKRRQDERKKGNVFQSRELNTLAGLLAVVFTLQALGSLILGTLEGSFSRFWSEAGSLYALTMADVRRIFIQGCTTFLVAAMPVLLVGILVSVVVTFLQTKGNVAGEAMKPKFSRMNPLQGFKRMFSMRGVMELLKSILKVVVLGYVIYSQYMAHFGELPRLMEMNFANVLPYAAAFIMDIITTVSAIYAFLAAADYLFQRWQYEKDLRMTKQEIKEEYKQTEGDPQIKGKIRERQRQMATSRMMANVPKADVIVRNPTHYAVALRYDAQKNRAPVVLAKGQDLVALRIIKLAEEHEIMLVENRPLARSLYENVPLDGEIPEEFYGAMAEVLAFVYAKRQQKPSAPPIGIR